MLSAGQTARVRALRTHVYKNVTTGLPSFVPLEKKLAESPAVLWHGLWHTHCFLFCHATMIAPVVISYDSHTGRSQARRALEDNLSPGTGGTCPAGAREGARCRADTLHAPGRPGRVKIYRNTAGCASREVSRVKPGQQKKDKK
jgi:hypothetical protein